MTDTFQQKDEGFLTYPTSGWHKALFKWPVHLWRLGLAPIIGHNMVLITHTGRKSGLPRRTMTELHVIEGKKYAPCAFGQRAQWYKNIAADPRVTIQTAEGAESVIAMRVTDDEELLSVMDHVAGPSQAILNTYLSTLEIEPTPEDILAKKERIYWFRFDPSGGPTPPPLPADLVWLWPAALGILILTWLLSRKK